MASPTANVFDLSAEEFNHLAADGYLIRRDVFTPTEIATIVDACETLVDDLIRERKSRRFKAGAYVFEMDTARETMIKWEGESAVVHGIEPCAHLSEVVARFALDERFIAPMRSMLNHASPMLFTEKLNLKRPRHGGVNPLHQDHPYWVGTAEVAAEVATAMLMLDDATVANGCLHVVPGSHTQGQWLTRRDDQDAFRQNEIDLNAYPDINLVPVELTAGSMVMFGPFLVHQSAPNISALPRRALLFSYQPGGREHMRDVQRRNIAEHRARRAAERAAQVSAQ